MTDTVIQKDSKRQLFFPAIILIFLMAGFWPLFPKLFSQWDAGDDSYCYMIIPLVFYLLWEKRMSFHFASFSWSYVALLPVIFSTMIIIIGELGSVLTLVFLGLWGCLVSILVVLYGKRVSHLIFPVLILAFIVPLPPMISRILTFKLRIAASAISAKMLQASGISAFREGNIIDLGVSQLQVVDACSGLRYLMPLLLMAILIGYFFNKRFLFQRLFLIFLVIPLSVLVNSFRIFVTGILTVNGYQKYAENFYHDFSGWLVFMIAGAILVGISLVLKMIKSVPHETPVISDRGVMLTGWLKPTVLSVIFSGLFIFSGFAIHYASDTLVIPERPTFESFPMAIGKWSGYSTYLPEDILKGLWADDYIQAFYRKEDIDNTITLFVPYYSYQETHHTVHAPQSCLLAGGWAIVSSENRSVDVGENNPIALKSMLMQKGDVKLLSLYFFFQRGRVISSPFMNKLYLMIDAIFKRRTDGALVRIEMIVPEGQSLNTAYDVIDGFLQDVWGTLKGYVPA
ncbi:MAG: VPLPA-CTERM-specific exosortase XrtD [Proteobacteria bacterium]|nr:VPLPA-CTERM-specific exosortase XrtD [Pseudomonadota bacterium]